MYKLSKETINKITKMQKLQYEYKKLYNEVKEFLINETDEEMYDTYMNDTIIDTTQYGTDIDEGIELLNTQINIFKS